jgi:hypothetical protein
MKYPSWWIACPTPNCLGAHEVTINGQILTPCAQCRWLGELRANWERARGRGYNMGRVVGP